MGEAIVFTSGKGGVGKTTTLAMKSSSKSKSIIFYNINISHNLSGLLTIATLPLSLRSHLEIFNISSKDKYTSLLAIFLLSLLLIMVFDLKYGGLLTIVS